ncbi:hypothetical protein FQN57_003544 [Myotisia sp. PD_48]|nr:hypothetical protein FQN57_003544 [Myotisia sp. PD_48]
MALPADNAQGLEQIPRETWSSNPNHLPQLTGPAIPDHARRFFFYSPSTLLKIGSNEGESAMTVFARSILGSLVPRVLLFVSIPKQDPDFGAFRQTIKTSLSQVLVHMREHSFLYYGRPKQQPYVSITNILAASLTNSGMTHALRHCTLLALGGPGTFSRALKLMQHNTSGPDGWDRPVFSHGDLSDRNILIDPDSLKITGFLDWEMANIMPAYYEYTEALLCGGHQPPWEKDVLGVLRCVLRYECNRDAANLDEAEERYKARFWMWKGLRRDTAMTVSGHLKTVWMRVWKGIGYCV